MPPQNQPKSATITPAQHQQMLNECQTALDNMRKQIAANPTAINWTNFLALIEKILAVLGGIIPQPAPAPTPPAAGS
jgi:hypothetical protein